MNYISLNIAFSDDLQAEILTAELADYPFESFEADAGTLKAYIPQERLADCKGEVDALLAHYGVQGRYIAIETQNWNAVWESNFPPVDVEGRLLIRAPFHEPAPAGVMEVVVMPKMSFGTGHHATTWLVSRAVLDLGVAGRRGLDMGSGTGVLSIVAAKCGAAHVDAVDIDDWADANCRENIASNGVADRIEPMLGDVRRIARTALRLYPGQYQPQYPHGRYAGLCRSAGAGRRPGDERLPGTGRPAIVACAGELGLRPVATAARDGWMMVHMRKG